MRYEAPAMTKPQPYSRTGLPLLVAGSAVDSTSGFFTRLLSADAFTAASGRGFFAALLLLAVLVWRDGRRAPVRLAAVGLAGAAFIALNSAGMVMNILSLKFTAVANFFMIFATAPFVAALAGRVVLGERLDRATLFAALAGFAGIAVMMSAGARGDGLVGDLLACACVLTYSGGVLIVRLNPGMDLLPVLVLTVLASGIVALPLSDFGALGGMDWAILAALGMFQLGVGSLLIFAAVARIPAAQAGLLGILNAGFAPVWVFLAFGEIPPPATIVGGGIIISAALLHLAHDLRMSKRASGAGADRDARASAVDASAAGSEAPREDKR
jgi:drug/metabolite transporter (DMT)-like permease